MRSPLKFKWLLPAAVFAALVCAAPARAQEPAAEDDYDGSRQIKLSGISKARPAAPGTNKSKASAPPVYERVNTGAWNPKRQTPAAPPAARTQRASNPPKRTRPAPRKSTPTAAPRPAPPSPDGLIDIGVTVWRLRPGKLAEAEPGVSFMTADGLAEMVTPVRLSGTDPVQLGDRLRFSIESPRAGFLYVINRTQYDDGTVEEPELIFPTTRARGGDNRVSPGRLVYIPALEDRISYFRVTAEGPAGKVNTGEIINIIISPKPIPELSTLTRDKVRISRELLAKWTSTWGDEARQEQYELLGGEGRPATLAEHEAGESGGSRSLTQEEPLPQTMYRVPAGANGPAMVTMQLTYGDATPKKSSAKK